MVDEAFGGASSSLDWLELPCVWFEYGTIAMNRTLCARCGTVAGRMASRSTQNGQSRSSGCLEDAGHSVLAHVPSQVDSAEADK